MRVEVRSAGFEPVDPDEHVVLARKKFRGVDFGHRKLRMFSSEGCRFTSCSFDDMVIGDASFGSGVVESEYVGCTFNRARLTATVGGFARFVDCVFDGTDIKRWLCDRVELINCTFTGRLSRAMFYGTVPEADRHYVKRVKNRFEGNDFSQAKLIDITFRAGVDLSLQRLPSGDEYVYLEDAAAAVERGRRMLEAWGDPETRSSAEFIVNDIDEQLAAGQRQAFYRPADFRRLTDRAIRQLFG